MSRNLRSYENSFDNVSNIPRREDTTTFSISVRCVIIPSSYDALNSNTSKPRNLPRRRRGIYYAPHKGVNPAFQGNSITEGEVGAHKLPIALSLSLSSSSFRFPFSSVIPFCFSPFPCFLDFSFLIIEDNISFKFCYYTSRYRCN